MGKRYFYDQEIRAEFATYNPYLKNDIRQVRMALNIPEKGFSTSAEAGKWYIEHYRQTKGEFPKPTHPWNWHLPKEFVEMIDSWSYSSQPSKAGFNPDIPLDSNAMNLIHKFGLPEKMVNSLKDFILKDEHNAMNIPSELQGRFLLIDEGEEGTKYIAIIAGLDEGTTKSEWDKIWQSFQVNLRLQGRKKAPNRRPIENLTIRNLTFWTWVKKDRKTAKEALDAWLNKHPEDSNQLNSENTVQKAIQKVDDLMKPIRKTQT